MKTLLRPAVRVAVFAFAVCLAACSTPRESDVSAEAMRPPPVAMAGETQFFDGRVRVSATLQRGERPHADARGERDGSGRRPHRGRPGGMGGGMRNGGERPGDDTDGPTPRIRPAGGPRLTLRVTLQNTSSAALAIQIRDVNSDLGNFAVRPERVELAPGESVELEPMFSELGNVVGDIPVQIGLRAENKTEANALVLKPEAPLAR